MLGYVQPVKQENKGHAENNQPSKIQKGKSVIDQKGRDKN